jgi:hypothetical protein
MNIYLVSVYSEDTTLLVIAPNSDIAEVQIKQHLKDWDLDPNETEWEVIDIFDASHPNVVSISKYELA